MPPTTESAIAIDTLLEPITPEDPAGPYVRYITSADRKLRESSQLYDDLEEARREEEDARSEGDDQVGNWSRTRKQADRPRAVELAATLLRGHTKDLQVAAWLAEALGRLHGVAGILQGLALLRGLTDRYWESLHPQGEDVEDRLYARSGVYEWLDSSTIFPLLILQEPIVSIPHEPSIRYSWLDEKRALDFEELLRRRPYWEGAGIPGPLDEESIRRWEQDGGVRIAAIRDSIAATDRAYYEALLATLNRCREAVESFNNDLRSGERFGEQAPVLMLTLERLETYRKRIERILQSKIPAQAEVIDNPIGLPHDPPSPS